MYIIQSVICQPLLYWLYVKPGRNPRKSAWNRFPMHLYGSAVLQLSFCLGYPVKKTPEIIGSDGYPRNGDYSVIYECRFLQFWIIIHNASKLSVYNLMCLYG